MTIAGIADGINPCAIGMMVMLLGYLLVFAKKPNEIVKMGLLYVATVFVTYLTIGLVFYSFVSQIQEIISIDIVNRVMGVVLGLASLIMLKDVVWRGKRIVEIKEWEHKAEKWMKLSLGSLLLLMSLWLLLG